MSDNPFPQPAKPFTRWTADTERAFLLALRVTGQVRKAAAEIGRATASAYKRRARDPGFALAWDEAVAAQQAAWRAAKRARPDRVLADRVLADGALAGEAFAGATVALDASDAAVDDGRLVRWRERRDGWNRQRRRLFLRTLAYTKDVRAACAAAKMSSTAAYYLRGNSPPFARAWERALARVLRSIDQAAYERAVTGWDEVVMRGGDVVSVKRRYSEALLRDLLRYERGEAPSGRAAGPAGAAGAAGRRAPDRGQADEAAANGDLTARAVAAVAALKGQPDPRGTLKNAAHRYADEVAQAAGGMFTLKAPREVTDAAIMKKIEQIEKARAAGVA